MDERAKMAANLRKGVLEFCALAAIESGDSYGLSLARRLQAAGLVSGDGAVYPLLSRMRREGSIESAEHISAGRPRRHLTLTPHGRAKLQVFRALWPPFLTAVTDVVNGEK